MVFKIQRIGQATNRKERRYIVIVGFSRSRSQLRWFIYQVVFQSDGGRLDPIFCPQFCENIRQVILDGRHTDVEPL